MTLGEFLSIRMRERAVSRKKNVSTLRSLLLIVASRLTGANACRHHLRYTHYSKIENGLPLHAAQFRHGIGHAASYRMSIHRSLVQRPQLVEYGRPVFEYGAQQNQKAKPFSNG